MSGASVHVVVSELGGTLVGLRQEDVVAADAPARPPSADAAAPDSGELDLATAWALPASDGPRRSLLVQGRDGQRRVLVGTQARLLAIPRRELLELPELLGALRADAGLQALFIADERIGFLLDVDWRPARGGLEGRHRS